MDLYLMRHGETANNALKLAQGNTDIPLNDVGRNQARQARSQMMEMGMPEFDLYVSSPLSRAVETVSIFGNVDVDDIHIIDDLHEMGFGVLEGTPFLEEPHMVVLNKTPELYEPQEGAETFDEMFARTKRALEEIVACADEYTDLAGEDGRGVNVLAGCHGMAIRGILGNIRGTGAADVWKTSVGNCDIFHLRYEQPEGTDEYDIKYWTELPMLLSHYDPYDNHFDKE